MLLQIQGSRRVAELVYSVDSAGSPVQLCKHDMRIEHCDYSPFLLPISNLYLKILSRVITRKRFTAKEMNYPSARPEHHFIYFKL